MKVAVVGSRNMMMLLSGYIPEGIMEIARYEICDRQVHADKETDSNTRPKQISA
ncbi:MAG: hypothetical protein N2Z65_06145 [Clostridiales bacterium]|nr:hypothetical protein [Clostridiales bacterium]